MDGGSGLNILYVDTLDAMCIPWSELHPVSCPFHGMILVTQAYPLGQIDLPIIFGDRANFRSEVLTFEVVDFLGSYHAILGRLCDAKFMVIPNYTYLKLKMPGPRRVITSFQHTYECVVECCGHATAIIAFRELVALKEEVVEGALDTKRLTELFDSVEGSKEVLIDPSSSEGKMIHIV